MSSERQPRPFFDQFQKLMDQMDTTSVSWWADTVAANRAALRESRSRRLEVEPDPTKAAELDRREAELTRLAEKFAGLREQYRLPRPSRSASAWLSILKEVHSNRVTSFTAVTAEESEAVIAELPNAISKGLSGGLDRETVVLRYDALNERVYHVVRRKQLGLEVWIWSDMGNRRPAIYCATS